MAPTLPSVDDLEKGRSVMTISMVAVGLLLFQLSSTCFGAMLDRKRAKSRSAKADGQTGCWVWGLCLSSYLLLIPGLVVNLFSFNIIAMQNLVMLDAKKSTLTFIHTLASTGGWLGCTFVVIFAIIIPLAKILMFFFAEHSRRSSNPSRVAHARWCILVLQTVSKWACPDMFAYILMMFLIRNLSVPEIVQGAMQLDIGFTCFTLFCVGSTVACLGVSMPPLASQDDSDDASETKSVETASKVPLAVKYLGTRGTRSLAALLLVVWLSLFFVGLFLPCMALGLNLEALVESGKTPRNLLGYLVNTLHLPERAKADVSIWKCMVALVGWASNGDLNTIIAFAMLAVFVFLFVCVDWLLLSHVVLGCKQDRGEYKMQKWLDPTRSMTVSRYLKKLCMLDVLIMGVLVVILSASIYKSQGLVLSPRWGLASLFAGEVCHYTVHSLLDATEPTTTASAAENPKDGDAAEAGVRAPEATAAAGQEVVACPAVVV